MKFIVLKHQYLLEILFRAMWQTAICSFTIQLQWLLSLVRLVRLFPEMFKDESAKFRFSDRISMCHLKKGFLCKSKRRNSIETTFEQWFFLRLLLHYFISSFQKVFGWKKNNLNIVLTGRFFDAIQLYPVPAFWIWISSLLPFLILQNIEGRLDK